MPRPVGPPLPANAPSIYGKSDKRRNFLAIAINIVSLVAALWLVGIVASVINTAASGGLPTQGEIWAFVIVLALASLTQAARAAYSARNAAVSENRHRATLAAHSLATDPAPAARTGSTVSLMTESVERIAAYRQGFLPQAIGALALPVIVLIYIGIWINPFSALVIAAAIPGIPLLVRGFMKMFRKVSSGSRQRRSQLAAAYLDAIEGMDTLQLIGAAPRIGARLAEQGEQNRRSTMQLLAGNQLVILVVDLTFSLFITVIATALAIHQYGNGTITLGQAAALILLSIILLDPIDQMGAFFYVGMGGMAAERAARRYLASKKTADAAPAPQTAPGSTPAKDALLTLENIHFSYAPQAAPASHGHPGKPGHPGKGGHPGKAAAQHGKPASAVPAAAAKQPAPRAVLKGVSLQLHRGERLAITGPSGQGKTTLLKILSGENAPASGSISLHGQPASLNDLRAASAVVTQKTWLFTGTIAHNLRLVNPAASETDMWRALEQAHVAADIRELPDRLETRVGERGYGLSGGQAQRIALARALLSGRTLLLLDEPTSAVDLRSEKLIADTLANLGPEYTLVMVTHRAGLLPGATRAVTVQNGTLQTAAEGAKEARQ
ncbi:ABC transporter ATP-binding protein/permease [Dermabacteraceae bacterium TAE3-ERU5]|nr:ABC transporter ATP-binding protein/permease [Dermabacteraceae bacterium TAE3-ERU5]